MTSGLPLAQGSSLLPFFSPTFICSLFIIFLSSSDCDVGIPLKAEECCKMIQDSVPTADLNGNSLECYNEYPVGSPSNPVNPGRVKLHTDAAGYVVHIPKNE